MSRAAESRREADLFRRVQESEPEEVAELAETFSIALATFARNHPDDVEGFANFSALAEEGRQAAADLGRKSVANSEEALMWSPFTR